MALEANKPNPISDSQTLFSLFSSLSRSLALAADCGVYWCCEREGSQIVVRKKLRFSWCSYVSVCVCVMMEKEMNLHIWVG